MKGCQLGVFISSNIIGTRITGTRTTGRGEKVKRLILLFALFSASSVYAQDYIRNEIIPPIVTRDTEIVPTGESDAICVSNTATPQPAFSLCSTLNITGKTVYYKPPEVTVGTLPASHGLSIVTDGQTSTDCTTGKGATKAWCWWNGTAWAALPGTGGGGTGTITGVTADTGLTGGGTTGTVALAVALSMRHTIISGPPSPAACQAGGEVIIDSTTVVNDITGVPYWCQAASENPVPFSSLGDGIVSVTTDDATAVTAAGGTALRVEGQDGIASTTNLTTTPKRIIVNYKLRGNGGATVKSFTTVGAFTAANQPAGDAVDILSSDAADVQQATIWGVVQGESDLLATSEIIPALTGTTSSTTSQTNWANIYAVELSSPATGTITIRKASNDATITTIPPGETVASQPQAIVTAGGGSSASSLQAAADVGRTINNAIDEDSAFRIGNAVNPWLFYTDALNRAIQKTLIPSDIFDVIPTDKTRCLFDEETGLCVETVDPDAASKNLIWQYGANYRPLKTIWFGARSLSTDGAQCAAPAEVTINSGAKRWTIICADSDTSTIYGEVQMPDSYDGAPVTLQGSFIQTAADTSNLNSDVAMACRGDGVEINNTWGTEVAMDTAMTGTNAIDTVTTGDITPNGTCTGGGKLLQFRWQMDAGGTTTAATTLHVVGFKLLYHVNSRSD